MSDPGSVSQWIDGLKADDADAIQQLWHRYSQWLIRLAKRQLGNINRGVTDGEDVTQRVFASLCRAASEGRLEDVTSRDDLWWLLMSFTRRKVADEARYATAQKRNPAGLNDDRGQLLDVRELISNEPSPHELATMRERLAHLLDCLRDDEQRSIAQLRLEGYTVGEIAEQLDSGKRSVERKLNLIRARWSKHIEQQELD